MEHLYKVDGKIFTDLKEAEKYEKILKETKEREEKLKKEEDNRIEEIRKAEKELGKLYDNFVEDYGYINIDLEIPKECLNWL